MRSVAVVLSTFVGLLSLSQEIAWVKIFSLAQQGRPQAFSLVLVSFLIGISIGSVIGRRVCERSSNVLRAAGQALLAAAAADVLSLALCATALVGRHEGSPRLQLACLLGLMLLVCLGAALKAIVFPIVHHVGSAAEETHIGRSVSYVYVGNVLGSTLGPVITGFFLLDRFPVEVVFGLVALGSVLLAMLSFRAAGTFGSARHWAPSLAMALVCVAVLAHPPEAVRRIADDGLPMKHLVQNSHGVIHVTREERPGLGDVTYGGNIYDGRLNVDVNINSNLLDRAYLVAAMHPRPRRVLVVGMSTGAWASVILGMPGVQQVDIVEINPGYLQVVQAYPAVAGVLTDPRVRIHVDDGRRWLRAHAGERYDVIFQNTTYHWRAYTTLLVSREYMGLLKSHLEPGGIVALNTTGSLDVFATAASVFPHAVRYRNFVYMSEAGLRKRDDALQVLRACQVWGQPAFRDAAFEPGQLGAVLAQGPLEPVAEYIEREHSPRRPTVISDLNMITEYRHGTVLPFEWHRKLLPADATGPYR